MNDKLKSALLFLTIFMMFRYAGAETLYVTDRILLGVHEAASKDSQLLASTPSGTSVEVQGEANGFKKVKLPDGTVGWIDAAYLVKSQPAPAQYDILLKKHERLQKSLDEMNGKLKKTERELQVRRDELSNAKTTIKELKKRNNSKNPVAEDPQHEAQLVAANEEITALKTKLAELEAAPVEAAPAQISPAAEEEIAVLRSRIELALRNLSGEEVLSAEQLARTRPAMPDWYWGSLVLAIILGVVAGVIWMDYRNRKRHGGFRI